LCPDFEADVFARVLLMRMVGVGFSHRMVSVIAQGVRDGNSVYKTALVHKRTNKYVKVGDKMALGASWSQGFCARHQIGVALGTRKRQEEIATVEQVEAWQSNWEKEMRRVWIDKWGKVLPSMLNNWDETPVPTDCTGNLTLSPKLLQNKAMLKCLAGDKEMMTDNIALGAEQYNKEGHGILLPSLYVVKGGTRRTLENVVAEYRKLGMLHKLEIIPGPISHVASNSCYVHNHPTLTYTHRKSTTCGDVKGTEHVTTPMPYILLKIQPEEQHLLSWMPGGVITIGPKGWMTGAGVRLQHALITIPYFKFVRQKLRGRAGIASQAEAMDTKDNYGAHLDSEAAGMLATNKILNPTLCKNSTGQVHNPKKAAVLGLCSVITFRVFRLADAGVRYSLQLQQQMRSEGRQQGVYGGKGNVLPFTAPRRAPCCSGEGSSRGNCGIRKEPPCRL
jgi:hypothetical protein